MQSGANNQQPPWQADGQDGDSLSFGTWLRRQREIREIPLNEIADVTKISVRYLEALEQDRFDVLPAPVFAKGFLREYARFVGLDPDEVINSYLTSQQEGEAVADESERVESEGANSSTILLVVGIVLLLSIVVGLMFYAKGFRDSVGAPAMTSPAVTAPASVPTAPAPIPVSETAQPESEPSQAEAPVPLVVTMDFTEDCWVEAVVDGQRRISELHVQGESRRIEAQREVVLTLGNPSGVRIEKNGEAFEPEVRANRVARDIIISVEPDAEAAEGRS